MSLIEVVPQFEQPPEDFVSNEDELEAEERHRSQVTMGYSILQNMADIFKNTQETPVRDQPFHLYQRAIYSYFSNLSIGAPTSKVPNFTRPSYKRTDQDLMSFLKLVENDHQMPKDLHLIIQVAKSVLYQLINSPDNLDQILIKNFKKEDFRAADLEWFFEPLNKFYLFGEQSFQLGIPKGEKPLSLGYFKVSPSVREQRAKSIQSLKDLRSQDPRQWPDRPIALVSWLLGDPDSRYFSRFGIDIEKTPVQHYDPNLLKVNPEKNTPPKQPLIDTDDILTAAHTSILLSKGNLKRFMLTGEFPQIGATIITKEQFFRRKAA